MAKIRVAIAGIGGVGGYFGGMLAKYYSNDPRVDICFIARGAHAEAIRMQGLRVETQNGDFIAHPALVSDDPALIGPVDYIIYCTKSYGLEALVQSLRPCIGPDTVLLPLLNGVDNDQVIRELLPQNEVWNGCVYLVAKRAAPGLIRASGNIARLFFGLDSGDGKRLKGMEQLFTEAGIDATLARPVEPVIWQKFMFISPVATLTSYLDAPIGEILAEEEKMGLFLSLLDELSFVAAKMNIPLIPDYHGLVLARMESLPYDTTSSMHRDFHAGLSTEVEALTGYVVRMSKTLNVPTPVYDKLYAELLLKAASL